MTLLINEVYQLICILGLQGDYLCNPHDWLHISGNIISYV